ncbi:MAG TPA: SRPBCC domain-containing protein [Ferruginibacter sp.]|nr:SRPBCC domain-containing protein [Ferruginibacter sp.]HRO18484.1 SRPBCC domain-containing protein [Ferruginibacter sp.]HRQ21469.1 SRPBCC domain-containing protein [Ferruginibacter sp.]
MKNFKAYYIIPAPPEEVYQALTQEATIQLWSGEPAEMQPEPDTEFQLFDGSIAGRNISFDTGREIVQEWYFGEEGEASIVTIRLHPHAKGTSAEVRHTHIPDEAYDNITDGWNTHYFGALQEFYS